MVMQLHYHVNILYIQYVRTISGPYYDERSLGGAWQGPALRPRRSCRRLGWPAPRLSLRWSERSLLRHDRPYGAPGLAAAALGGHGATFSP
jgi:hypothetical protein